MLRPEPVLSAKNESERDGPQFESERDGPKVGVIPPPATVLRRSQRLLDNNSEGNRLIPASACVKAKRNERNLMSSGGYRSSTGMECQPSRESQSLGPQTRPLTNPSLSSSLSSLDRPHSSPLSLTPFLPSQGGKDRHPGSQGGDEFPSLSLKGKQTQPKLGAANIGSVPVSVIRCPGRSPLVGSSKLESEQTLSEMSRPAMSVKDYNKAKSSRPGSGFSRNLSF